MASGVYNHGKAQLFKGALAWDSGVDSDFQVLLVGTGYTPNPDHDHVSDVIAYELSGTGYSRQNLALAGRVVVEDDTNDRAQLSANSVTWTGISAGTIRYAIVFKNNTNDNTRALVAWIDSTMFQPSGLVTNGGDVVLSFPNGVLRAS